MVRILIDSGRLDDFKRSPQAYIEVAGELINRVKQAALVDGIRYQRVGDGDYYAQELFEEEELMGYVPPQDPAEIVRAMSALERFINDDAASDLDPLVKMAVIHHQFESIHPFTDGNGRIGRIINVLYLTRIGLLDIPVLYLSRYITLNKAEYYRLLQSVRDSGDWEPWLVFMLEAVSATAQQTLDLVAGMRDLMADYKRRLRDAPSVRYSQDLLNNLFRHPYTRIEFVQADLGVTRQTAAKYLEALAAAGLVEKHQQGRNNYYINTPLIALLMRASGGDK